MTGRELTTSTAEPGRFVLTLGWPGETEREQCQRRPGRARRGPAA